MRLDLSPRAENDLEDIAEWLVPRNPGYAARLTRSIERELAEIATFPGHYRLRPELQAGTRIATVDRYVILFHTVGDRVRVDRIVLGSRDLAPLLRQ